MASLLSRAKSAIGSTPNKNSSIVTTEVEIVALPAASTIRLSRLTKIRRNFKRTSLSSLHSRRIPSVTIPPPATLLPTAPLLPPASCATLAELHDFKKGVPSSMNTSDQMEPASASAPPPVPFSRLREIANSACEAALASASAYDHSSTESWNTSIINTILQSLVQETSTPTSQPQYKFAINSTIIEHMPPSSATTSGKRGMHSAAAAYWNAEKDGMWNFKYEGAEEKGLDVVVGIIWISI